MPKRAICSLYSLAPYQMSAYVRTPREKKETHDAHEERTWMERAHLTAEKKVYIPAMAFRHAIADAARYLGPELKIPGGKGATYVKHFEAGLMIEDNLVTQHTEKDIRALWLFVPGNPGNKGRGGGGSRVPKRFPVLDHWEGDVSILVLDDTITQQIFERVLHEAGNFIGVGAFRIQNRGNFGRFAVKSVTWQDLRVGVPHEEQTTTRH